MKKKIVVLILIIVLIPIIVYAHKGRTDSSGGHYVGSSGEYHYHHGYPAHQHANGVCPYKNDNKTQYSSGTVANNTSLTAKFNANVLNDSTKNTTSANSVQYDKYFKIGGCLLLFAWILVPIHIIANLPETVKEETKENTKRETEDKPKTTTTIHNTTRRQYVCPRCGGKLIIKSGKYGKFIGCSNYPLCKYTKNIRK